ncbi:hypothetical protein BDV12DRAFT_74442 [Aspergillus spectabilis]
MPVSDPLRFSPTNPRSCSCSCMHVLLPPFSPQKQGKNAIMPKSPTIHSQFHIGREKQQKERIMRDRCVPSRSPHTDQRKEASQVQISSKDSINEPLNPSSRRRLECSRDRLLARGWAAEFSRVGSLSILLGSASAGWIICKCTRTGRGR